MVSVSCLNISKTSWKHCFVQWYRVMVRNSHITNVTSSIQNYDFLKSEFSNYMQTFISFFVHLCLFLVGIDTIWSFKAICGAKCSRKSQNTMTSECTLRVLLLWIIFLLIAPHYSIPLVLSYRFWHLFRSMRG
jgi:hypothetical protein